MAPAGCDPQVPDDCNVPPGDVLVNVTVTYTPSTAENLADSFVYRVEDACEAVGMATVLISPGDDPADPPADPPAGAVVVANPIPPLDDPDARIETEVDTVVTITLTGEAPDGVGLGFSIASGPTNPNAVLDNLIQGTRTPRRRATVDYTPESGFIGSDSFIFEACGDLDGDGDTDDPNECDTASVEIDVVPLTTLAEDQEAAVDANASVGITLIGNSGGIGDQGVASLAPITRLVSEAKAVGIVEALAVGTVTDTDLDGDGDVATGRLVYLGTDASSNQHGGAAAPPLPNAASELAGNAARWASGLPDFLDPVIGCVEGSTSFGSQVELTLEADGLECASVIPVASLATADLSGFDVVYVGASTVVGDLVTAASNVQAHVDGGGGLVVEPNVFDPDSWSWVPFAADIGHSGSRDVDGQAVTIVETGHPVVFGLTDAELSNWGDSVHTTFSTPEAAGFLVVADGFDSQAGGDVAYIIVRPETVSAATDAVTFETRFQIEFPAIDPAMVNVPCERLIAELEGGGVRFQGELRQGDGGVVLDRTTLRPLPDGRVRQVIEQSRDGGETWQVSFDAVYVPLEPAP